MCSQNSDIQPSDVRADTARGDVYSWALSLEKVLRLGAVAGAEREQERGMSDPSSNIP
jgi:hypothetical protein